LPCFLTVFSGASWMLAYYAGVKDSPLWKLEL